MKIEEMYAKETRKQLIFGHMQCYTDISAPHHRNPYASMPATRHR